MKTTIKLSATRALHIAPNPTGVVVDFIETLGGGYKQATLIGVLTPDQIGALTFALEAAEEASQLQQLRAASVAHGVDL